MHVIAVINRKGGVGKTTTAVNIAAALALGGQRTLLVDLDPQGSAGRSLGVAPGEQSGSSAAFSRKPVFRPSYPKHPDLFRLGVVAADPDLGRVEHDLLGDDRRRQRLADSLAGQREHWSVCVLDTPPALGGLADAALRAADGVLIPVAADFLAVDALRATLATVRAAEKAGRNAFQPLALLATFVEERRRGARAALALLREQFGDLLLEAAVPRSARFDSTALAGVPVVLAAPASAPALAYAQAARALLAATSMPPRRVPGRPRVKRFVRADMREALRSLKDLP